MSPSFRILIIYGSQTGNARAIAERLAVQACRLFRLRNFPADNPCSLTHVCCANEYQPLQALATEPGPVVFVCSTTGSGNPPDNMYSFWRKIMNVRLPEGSTFSTSLRFVVLGLGDSSYKEYNYVAKILYRRLVHLGASPLPVSLFLVNSDQDIGLALCDESLPEGSLACLQQFIPSLWNTIFSQYSYYMQPLGTFAFPVRWEDLENPTFIASLQPRFFVEIVKKTTKVNNGINPANNLELHHQKFLSDFISVLVKNDDDHLNASREPPTSSRFIVFSNQRLTPDDYFQDTRLIHLKEELKNDDSPTEFLPGAVLEVQPHNSAENVLSFFSSTGLSPEIRLSINVLNESLQPGEHIISFPLPDQLLNNGKHGISLAWLATYYFDLNAVPSQLFFLNLAAAHIQSKSELVTQIDDNRAAMEFDRLCELGQAFTAEAIDDFHDYVNRPRRRIFEILVDFPCTTSFIPASKWLDILPGPIQSRPYSIASASPTIEILVAVVKYRTRMSTPRYGLASSFLANSSEGSVISGRVSRPSYGFDFSYNLTNTAPPCILVGPGTGVAPLRAFILHQLSRRLSTSKSQIFNVLFFGCRFSYRDFYFQSEWKDLQDDGCLKLITAFSREGHGLLSKNRVYVQHKIVENADFVWSLLNESRGSVYVSGNAKLMPAAVRDAIVEVVKNSGNMEAFDAESFVSNLESSGRFQVEAWT